MMTLTERPLMPASYEKYDIVGRHLVDVGVSRLWRQQGWGLSHCRKTLDGLRLRSLGDVWRHAQVLQSRHRSWSHKIRRR